MFNTFHTCKKGSSSIFESHIKELSSLDICCSLVGTYPAYIAGVLSSHYADQLRLSELCIARTDSPILDNIYRKFPNFNFGTYKFHLNAEDDDNASFPDYSVYEITHDGVTVPFLITVMLWLYNVYENQTLIWPNSCGRMTVFLLSKCTVLSVFLSTRLRSSTYTIKGLLVGVGHPIPSSKNA